MDYGDFIACITEMMIKHKMQEGLNYAQASDETEDFLTSWIIVGEERAIEKEEEKENEDDR